MPTEAQEPANKILVAKILESEWPLCIVAGDHQSVAARLVRVGVAVLALPIVLVLIGWKEGNLLLPRPAIGLMQDWNILAMFVAFPAAVLLLVLAARRLDEFLNRLVGLIDQDGDCNRAVTVAEIKATYTDIVNGMGFWRALRWIGIIAGLSFVAFNALNRYFRFSAIYASGFWTSSQYPLSFWATCLYTLMVWGYLAPIIAFKLISLLVIISRIVGRIGRTLKFKPTVLSPDRAGGLKALGSVALALSYVVLPFQLNCLVYYYWIPKVNPPFVIGVSIVLTFTVVLFSIPVWFTHRAMTRARDAVLEKVSDLYNRRLKEVLSDSCEVAPQGFERVLGEMKALEEVFDTMLRIRVWPVDLGVIGRFSAVVAVPLVVAFLQQLLKLK